MIKSRVVRQGDTCVLEVDGRIIPPYGYLSYQPEQADYPFFRELGVKLLFLPVYAGDRGINPASGTRPFYPGFWTGEDCYDFSAAEALFKTVRGDAKPGEVYVIPRVMIEPPSFWEKAHPDCLARDYAGASVHQCYSSEKWLHDSAKAIGVFCGWLKTSGFDAYTAGIQLAAGHTEEFFEALAPRVEDFLVPGDRETTPEGELRWRRATRRARRDLTADGFIVAGTPGEWLLTDLGMDPDALH